MSEIDAVRTARPRITQTAQQRWLDQARQFLRDGETKEAVDAYLQNQGCPPRLRGALLLQADSARRGRQRRQGLRVLALGLGVIALGAAIEWWAMHGGSQPFNRLAFWGMVTAASGLQIGLVGAWKLVTGSRVDITADIP